MSENLKVWIALFLIATLKVVSVIAFMIGLVFGFQWIVNTFSTGHILIGIGVLFVIFWITLITFNLRDDWRRGKIHFKWEKK